MHPAFLNIEIKDEYIFVVKVYTMHKFIEQNVEVSCLSSPQLLDPYM